MADRRLSGKVIEVHYEHLGRKRVAQHVRDNGRIIYVGSSTMVAEEGLEPPTHGL